MENREFTRLLIKAKCRCLRSQHNIWLSVCHNQTKAFFKSDNEFLGVGYITFIKALEQYNLKRLPKGKSHRYQFPAYYKNKLRFAMQTERRTMDYPVKASRYQLAKGDKPIRNDIEELANV